MRPPEFTGGNCRPCSTSLACTAGFNEAAGIHRRKLQTAAGVFGDQVQRFNEAAGIHRRKPAGELGRVVRGNRASMRPPEFTGGNEIAALEDEIDMLRLQ